MNKNFKVSIIMPCYNDGIYLEEAIESALNQTLKDIEIIIIDDASIDQETLDVLSKLDKDNLTVIYLEKNVGPAVARNKGIELAKGKYILPLDSDDKIAPTYVEKAVKILEEDNNIGIVYCEAELFGEQQGKWNLPAYSFSEILIGNMIFATAMYRKEDWKKVNGYNENMVHGYEDYDFWLLLLELGNRVYQIPEILFSYRIKKISRSTKLAKELDNEINSYMQIFENHQNSYIKNVKIIYKELKNKQNIIQEKDQQIQEKDQKIQELHAIAQSLRFKNIVKKFIPSKVCKLLQYIKHNPRAITLGWHVLKTRGVQALIYKIKKVKHLSESQIINIYTYREPVLSQKVFKEIENFRIKPFISIIMPVYNVDPKWLDLAIKSIETQWYSNWELCIADDKSTNKETTQYLQAITNNKIKTVLLETNGNISAASNEALKLVTGEYVALMDNDDELTPDALYEVVKAINETNAEFIYSDEDKLEMDSTFSDPHFKPDFAPDMFLSQNYISHLGVIKKELVDKVNGFTLGLEGSQDYDLYLKVLEHTDSIYHIQKVLYHWRKVPGSTAAEYGEKSYAQEAGRKALDNAMKRRGIKADVVNGLTPGTYKVNYEIIGEPLVSIIIPFKDMPKLLSMCIESILEKTSYQNFEIIGISNNSENKATFVEMSRLEGLDKRIKFYEYNVPFNYSDINNHAVKEYAKGEHLLFLNNDIELITSQWIEELLMHSQRANVGAVGAKLYFPNNTIQHAGLAIAPYTDNAILTMYNRHPHNTYGYMSRAKCIMNYSAVTAACMMCKKELFSYLNGFDTKNLKVAYNDVDLCLRMQEEGCINVWSPFCELYHHESISRGYENSPKKLERLEKEKYFLKQKHKNIFQTSDPYYNKNLTYTSVNSLPNEENSQGYLDYIGLDFKENKIIEKNIHPKSKNRICLFSHYDKNNRIEEYILYYLSELSKITDIVFISTAEKLSLDELKKVSPYCRDILVKENYGYDFGAWKSGLNLLGNKLNTYDELILCNDSVFGPFSDLEVIFMEMKQKKYDFWSMTDNYEISYHLQSYFIVYTKKAFTEKVFQDFWKNFKIYNNKKKLIEMNEIRFSKNLQKTELTFGAYCTTENYSYLNIMHYYWKDLILNKKYPFIKKELLRDNPIGLNISNWKKVISSISNYNLILISKSLTQARS